MTENYKFINLGSNTDEKIEMSSEENINYKKQISKLRKQCLNESRTPTCFCCNKPVKGLCNSHSVPMFSLKNIAVDGKVFSINHFIKNPHIKSILGLNECGTFHIICKDCDNSVFQDYENENAYICKPNTKILAEISLKNSLKYIYKRRYEDRVLTYTNSLAYSNQKIAGALDIIDYKKLLQYSKKAIEKNYGDEFYLYDYYELDYTVPIAFQGLIALQSDFNGCIINDTYNFDPNYEVKQLQIAVFPLKQKSIILIFVEKTNHRYRSFFKQFLKYNYCDRLKIINYLIFAFSEDVYLSPSIEKESLDKIKEIAKMTSYVESYSNEKIDKNNLVNAISNRFNYEDAFNVPNLLSEEYKINN